MKLFLPVTALLAAVAVAAPAAEPEPAASAKQPRKFYLKTINTKGHDKFDGLYVATYHTFAGGNAAYLVKNTKYLAKSFIEDKALYFAFGPHDYDQYPMQLDLTDPSAAWGTVSINIVDKPDKHFKINDDGNLVIDYQGVTHGHAHWRVCEWSHSVPELFWNNPLTWDNINPDFVPATCELVNLRAVYL